MSGILYLGESCPSSTAARRANGPSTFGNEVTMSNPDRHWRVGEELELNNLGSEDNIKRYGPDCEQILSENVVESKV